MTWHDETQRILHVALLYNIDPLFIAAIRKTENGGPGREFGITEVEAPLFDDQLLLCVRAVRRYLVEYPRNPLTVSQFKEHAADRRIHYCDDWIAYAGRRYCIVGDAVEWFDKVTTWYRKFLRAGLHQETQHEDA